MNLNFLSPARICLTAGLLLASSLAQAGISLGATRVILQAPAKEGSIQVKNEGSYDIMIQSWLDTNAGETAVNTDDPNIPFALTPSLSRLAAGKQQTVRIFYQGQGLPTDRESVLWLSVQEIPPKPDAANTLQLAVRQRIKLFYRPASLPGSPTEAAQKLNWRLIEREGKPALEVRNPSAYHISLAAASMDAKRYQAETRMVPPGATEVFTLTGASGRPSGSSVDYQVVNDYGGLTELSSPISR